MPTPESEEVEYAFVEYVHPDTWNNATVMMRSMSTVGWLVDSWERSKKRNTVVVLWVRGVLKEK